MSFDPQKYLIDLRGKDYLMVRWRVVWFRDEHPTGNIRTELVSTDPVVMRAIVFDGEGRELASGFGTPKMQGVAKLRPFEGAETAAIGRALALAGYGTQLTGEDEGEHLADAPVSPQQKPQPVPASPAGVRPWSADDVKSYIIERVKHHAATNKAYSGHKGAMVGELDRSFGGDKERKAAILWMTTKSSTGAWSDATWLAFSDWLSMTKTDDGVWVPSIYVPQEAKAVVKEALKSQGQKEMEI